MAVGPLILLLLLNSAIILHLLFGGNDGRRFDSSTMTLIIVVILFIVCNVPGLTANVIEWLDGTNPLLSYIIDISNLLVVFNSSANFIVYMTFDSSFRQTFMRITTMHSTASSCPNDVAIWQNGNGNAHIVVAVSIDDIRRSAFFSQL